MNPLPEKAVDFLRLVAAGNVRNAYEKYVSPDFRHHNAYCKGDRTSLLKAMEENTNHERIFEVKHVFSGDDFVTVLSHLRQNPQDTGMTVVHILRFQNERIVEMWDLGQKIPDDFPNENGIF